MVPQLARAKDAESSLGESSDLCEGMAPGEPIYSLIADSCAATYGTAIRTTGPGSRVPSGSSEPARPAHASAPGADRSDGSDDRRAP